MSLFDGDLFLGETYDGEYFRGGDVILVQYRELRIAEMVPIGVIETRPIHSVTLAGIFLRETLT